MMRHLTEDDLIRFEFDLCEGDAEDMSSHLGECDDCRSCLDALKRKFSSLDLLSEEICVSDELVARAVSDAERPVRRNNFLMGGNYWMGIAAAVLLTGSVIFAVYYNSVKPGGEIALGPVPTDVVPPANIDLEKGTVFGGGALGSYGVELMDEKAPFAPASAIELVVLPRRDKVQLTIYNSADLTLVRERRNLTMKKGWNWLQFMWANTLIDPTSLALEPLAEKDKIDVQQLVYPARLKDIGRWLIRSEAEGQVPFEITYLTSGLKWRAFYMGTLSTDEKTMHLAGHVRVDNNSGEDYENAQTRLIVGKVNVLDEIAQLARRQYPYGRPGVVRSHEWGDSYSDHGGLVRDELFSTIGGALDFALDGDVLALGRKQIVKEGLSEYFLYTIEGTETIANTWGKRLPSFEADDIPVESLYKYDEQRWGANAIRFLSFVNDEDHELGETPIPDGAVKVYSRADSEGHLSYVGGTAVKYIPVDEEVELNLGAARHVKVECVLMDAATANYEFDYRRDIGGWDEVRRWKVAVTNTRDIPVKVEVYRNFSATYWDIEKSGEFGTFEEEDMDTVKFTLGLPARSKREFGYVLTTYHGTREEARAESGR